MRALAVVTLVLAVGLSACGKSSLALDDGSPGAPDAAADTRTSIPPPPTDCPQMLHAVPSFWGTPCALPPGRTCKYLGGLCQCAGHVEEVWACKDGKWEKIMSTSCPSCPPPPPPPRDGSGG